MSQSCPLFLNRDTAPALSSNMYKKKGVIFGAGSLYFSGAPTINMVFGRFCVSLSFVQKLVYCLWTVVCFFVALNCHHDAGVGLYSIFL